MPMTWTNFNKQYNWSYNIFCSSLLFPAQPIVSLHPLLIVCAVFPTQRHKDLSINLYAVSSGILRVVNSESYCGVISWYSLLLPHFQPHGKYCHSLSTRVKTHEILSDAPEAHCWETSPRWINGNPCMQIRRQCVVRECLHTFLLQDQQMMSVSSNVCNIPLSVFIPRIPRIFYFICFDIMNHNWLTLSV